MQVIKKENYKVPVLSWCPEIEDNAMKQIDNLAQLPFVFKRVVILPDAHMGFGMPIGAVIATQGVVIPHAVGSDVACGVCAVKTSLTEINTDTLKKIMGEIRKVVPVGFGRHKEKQNEHLMPMEMEDGWLEGVPIVKREYYNALYQLGTLGSGNHFISIERGDDNHIWIMIHSGSRNLGYQVAKHYNELAIKLNEKYFSQVPKEHELAFLPLDSEEGKSYLKEMQYCVDYALANRKLMMDRIQDIIVKYFRSSCSSASSHTDKDEVKSSTTSSSLSSIKFEPMINIAHNYASLENHFSKNVMVHRKGATQARKGQLGIIPGSQGTKSYIVEGLGNDESFQSCSHGAGRTMGRKQAQRELNLADEIKRLDDKGIIHSIRGVKDLEEAPSAYKNVEEVMANQTDLVNVLVELSPLCVIKG